MFSELNLVSLFLFKCTNFEVTMCEMEGDSRGLAFSSFLFLSKKCKQTVFPLISFSELLRKTLRFQRSFAALYRLGSKYPTVVFESK